MIFSPTKSGDLAICILKIMSIKILCYLFRKICQTLPEVKPNSSSKLRSLTQTLTQSPLSMIWCYKTKLDFKSHSSSKSEIVSILVQFPSTVPVSSNFSVQSPQGCASFFIYHGYIIFYID